MSFSRIMDIGVELSQQTCVFQGRTAPEPGTIVGYAAIMHNLQLPVPVPEQISLISTKNRKYQSGGWQVFGPRYRVRDTLYHHLVFAFRYEGVRLLILKKLFHELDTKEIVELVQIKPSGQYCRKLWFLYEWLMHERLPVPDADVKVSYKFLLDPEQQFAINNGTRSARHRIINNLPGTPDFCPLVFKTEKLRNYIVQNLSEQEDQVLTRYSKDLLQRAASFLLLQDSRASFTIERESPRNNRTARWGQAMGEAGNQPLSRAELLRLQQLVIGDQRFVDMGLRKQGGFVGKHDRGTGVPLPDHISARPQDLERLINGLIETSKKLEERDIDAVIAATIVAFGFVFIHPFEDGNGRIHRYLIHHMLARKEFIQQGVIFPVSAAILDHIDEYRRVLEAFSHPLLDFIQWTTTSDNNVEVLNDTIDYYRYFDATHQAEFLYDMVKDTLDRMIPQEINYLAQYDRFKQLIDERFDMPDKTVALLMRFLEQNNGKLSIRARQKEFSALTDEEVQEIEQQYATVFLSSISNAYP